MGPNEPTADNRPAVEALAQSLYETEDPGRVPWAKRAAIVREPWLRRARVQLKAQQQSANGNGGVAGITEEGKA
jgi:hypothetical protein